MDDILFVNRRDAGVLLARELARYRGTNAIVLGIPRGGVPVAAEVARELGVELDVVVARKLGAPFSPELAIGAVTADGECFLNEPLIREIGVSSAYLQQVTERERAEALRREELFRGTNQRGSIRDRTVIIVDDGLATGATMRASVRSARRQGAAKIVVAVPVGSQEACAGLRGEADEVVCLFEPEPFYAVGLYYEHFDPTTDEEVRQSLAASHVTSP